MQLAPEFGAYSPLNLFTNTLVLEGSMIYIYILYFGLKVVPAYTGQSMCYCHTWTLRRGCVVLGYHGFYVASRAQRLIEPIVSI